MGLENTTAKYTVQIVQDGTTAPAVTEFNNLRKAAEDAAKGTRTATSGLHELKETSTLTRESTRVLSEAVLILGGGSMGELAKGALLASEGLKVVRSSALLFKTELSTILPIIGAVSAAVGAGVFVWRALNAEQKQAVENQNALSQALADMPQLLQRINNAASSGAVSQAQSNNLLQSIGAQRAHGAYNLTLPDPQNYSTNAQLPGDFHISTSQAGIPDAIDIRKVNEELVKTGELLKVIDDQGNASYVENPSFQAVITQNNLVKQMSLDRLDGFEKERAQAEATYNAEIEKLKQISQLEQFIQDPDQRKAALAGNASAVSAAGSTRDAALSRINAAQDDQLEQTYNQSLAEENALLQEIDTEEKKIWADKKAALEAATTQEKQLGDLERQITLSNLTGEERKQQAIQDTMATQIEQFTKLSQELGMSQQETDAWIAKIKSGAAVQSAAVEDSTNKIRDWQDMGESAEQSFSSGFANAFVSFANGSESAGKAFANFAENFLSQIAEMIIQSLVLRSIMGFVGGVGGGGADVPIHQVAAQGGMFPRMMAAGGFAGMVNRATYFPRFNVVAGEAGGEMLAALARPTFRSIGGIDAVVGNAGGSRLAITDAGDLARGGGRGGLIQIRVDMHPDLKAEIISSSVKGAQVQVAHDLGRNTPIAKGVKTLTA